MDDAWRFRPPPPSFDDLNRFRRPFLPGPPLFPNPVIRGTDPRGGVPPPLERSPFFPASYPPPPRFLDDEREIFRKRMRVDDPSQPRISSEDERRLNLVRDHGREGFYPGFAARDGPPLLPMHGFSYQGYPMRPNGVENYQDFPGPPNSQSFGSFAALEFERRDPYSQLNQSYRRSDPVGVFGNQGPHVSLKQQQYTQIDAVNTNESYLTPQPQVGENRNLAMHTLQTYLPLPLQSLPPVHHEVSPPKLQVPPSLPSVAAPPTAFSPSPASATADTPLPPAARTHPSSQAGFYSEPPMQAHAAFPIKALSFKHEAVSTQYSEEGGPTYQNKHLNQEKPTVIDACHLFRQPNRVSRPDHFVIILRGLPGSGKSYLAKALRDIEVENGGNAPRIHAMDDYFMIEVEKKVEDNVGPASSSSARGKKQNTKKVIEYHYEPEMEEAYRASMLKAFKKTLDEGIFTFIIVDDRNLRVADFAQFWAIAKRSGYEVYLLEATYKDPMGCAARNIHGFTVDNINKMASQWEEAPPLYLQLDIRSLFHGDELNEHSIQEVDMDMDDTTYVTDNTHELKDSKDFKIERPTSLDPAPDGLVKVGDRWDAVGDEEEEEPIPVKELGKSKWLKDFYEDLEDSGSPKENSNVLSGLLQAYGKGDKSVHWGDQVDKSGFSITAVKRKRISSLIIGPGCGYNLDSNPLQEEVSLETTGRSNMRDSKKWFQEQLRAERESFKVVFDRRRQRIDGFNDTEDD